MTEWFEDPDYGKHINEKFGDVGVEIADIADILIEYWSGEPEPLGDPSQVMPDSDNQALGYWLSMESVVPLVEIPYEVTGDVRRQAHDALVAFHVALPYNEAERQWLGQTSRRAGQRKPGDQPERIAAYEDTIMMAGVRQAVSGRELMRRWPTWRRETGEYAGQGALDEARQALRTIQELMR
jgi:hypothetical protein